MIMKNQDFIKSIKDIYSNATWNVIAKTTTEQQSEDVIKSSQILNNSKKMGYNTLSLLIEINYHSILDTILTKCSPQQEDKLTKQQFEIEFAKLLAPFVAKHILKRYVRVSGMDRRTKMKNEIVLNIDFAKTIYSITTYEEKQEQKQA